MAKSRILFFAGSARKESLNARLATAAASIARSLGAETTLIDLRDYEMPLYNGDWETENGLPEAAQRLKKLFIEHDAVFIASPEYNSSFSPLLKNTLDWISRAESNDEPPLAAYKGKVAALAATSPGGLGGIRGLVPLRMMLGNIGVHVLPTQVAIPKGHAVFTGNDLAADSPEHAMLSRLVKECIDVAGALGSVDE